MNRATANEELPVLRAREEVLAAMQDGGAMALTAATGSGKTTQVPQMLLKSGCVKGEIVVLEPRRLAARLTARRVAQELGCALGQAVGFQTRFERAVSAQTRIRFVTDGVFLRQAQRDPALRGIGAVLLDEFHERSLFADVALGMVKRAREARGQSLAVGVMSATMDAGAVATYLGARVVTAEGRAFPVDIRNEPGDPKAPVWDRAARAVRAALEEQGEGDALVFMAGAYEIDRTMDAVRVLVRGMAGGDRVDVVGLHGSMPPAAQDAAVAPARSGRRKVIVSTNVAETSITIPGIRIVVDAGQARVFRADPMRGLNALRVEPISRASADQRAGRAGRTAPGLCVRLWGQREHAQRAEMETPEIQRVELSEAMLMVGGPSEFAAFPWLDAPEQAAVDRARETLELVGAVEAEGAVDVRAAQVGGAQAKRSAALTPLGHALARVPAHPRLARALVAAAEAGVLARAAVWCALAAERDVIQRGVSTELLRLTPNGEPPSDLGAREELVQRVAASEYRMSRHEGVEASIGACREVMASARDLTRAVQESGEAGSRGSFAQVSRAMLAGFPDHVAWRVDAQRPHCTMPRRRKVSIDRDSIQRGAGFVLALEIREGGRGDQTHQSLGMVTPLETEWVEEAMPHRFSTRTEVRFSDELGASAEFEERLFDGIVIAQTVRPLRGKQAKEAAHGELAARVASGELKPASWNEGVDQWIARVRCTAEWFPERGLIRYDNEDLAVLAAEIVQGCARASEVEARQVMDIVRNALSWEEQQLVEKAAPESILLPKGFRMRLTYEPGKPPTGRAKIQDFYDLQGHPCVAGGRVKVRLELLGPNFRPVQITDDLPGFWERLYPEVKKELKRRYPRHEWR